MRLELKEHEREHVVREKAKEYKENEDRAALVSAAFPAISEVFSQSSLMTRQGFLDSVRCPSSPHLKEPCIISVLACLLKLLAKQFKIALESVTSIGGEIVSHVGRARDAGRRGAWIGPNRLHRRRNGGRPIKQNCDKIELASFLKDMGYPLRENPGDVVCVAFFYQVTLEAQDRTKPLSLCKNHCEWVKERESKLRELNVRVRFRAPGEAQ